MFLGTTHHNTDWDEKLAEKISMHLSYAKFGEYHSLPITLFNI